MNIREQFKRRVIELIHGLPYEEAIEKERPSINPITIGRVMKALKDKIEYAVNNGGEILEYVIEDRFHHTGIGWKLTKENGEECTDDDQSDETIEELLSLLK